MAAAIISEKSKNRHISATVRLIATKFGTTMQVDHLDRSDRQISNWK